MKLQALRCGGCGCDTVRLFVPATDSNPHADLVVARCTKCNSNSAISLQSPKLVIEFPSNVPELNLADGDGCLASGWGD